MPAKRKIKGRGILGGLLDGFISDFKNAPASNPLKKMVAEIKANPALALQGLSQGFNTARRINGFGKPRVKRPRIISMRGSGSLDPQRKIKAVALV